MPGTALIVGLDVGTTGVKAVAFGLGSGWRRVALREYPLLQPTEDQAVQDPPTVLAAIAEALAECVQAAGEAQVIAISVSAAMHGLIALDAELQPLTPLITWADARAREEALVLRRSGAGLHALSGTPVHPMTPLSKLLWFSRHEPQTLTRARWWAGLKDLVLAWLTGTLVTELSSASATGMLDMRRAHVERDRDRARRRVRRPAARDPSDDLTAAAVRASGAADGTASRDARRARRRRRPARQPRHGRDRPGCRRPLARDQRRDPRGGERTRGRR